MKNKFIMSALLAGGIVGGLRGAAIDRDPQWLRSAWYDLSRAIERADIESVRAIVPDVIVKNKKRNDYKVKSNGKIPYEIALFHYKEKGTPELKAIVEYLNPAQVGEKVGIKPEELQAAKDLAQEREYKNLYQLFGGVGVIGDRQLPLAQEQIDNVLWPALVWAIEEGKAFLATQLAGIIGFDTKKPYGKSLTASEIARYNNQQKVFAHIKNAEQMSVMFPGSFAKPKNLEAALEIERTPWTAFASFVEEGNLKGVEHIISKKQYIGVREQRVEPGKPSHGKTPIDIAEYLLERSRNSGASRDLIQKQENIVNYLKSMLE